MKLSFFLLFTILSFVNVFGSTIKTLTQLKCSKAVASLTSAIYFGFYTVVLVYTVSEGIPLWGKVIIVAICNFFGTYLANAIFEKATKKELIWRVTVSIPECDRPSFEDTLRNSNLEYREFGNNNGWFMYDIYCNTSDESHALKCILPTSAKYIINEGDKVL